MKGIKILALSAMGGIFLYMAGGLPLLLGVVALIWAYDSMYENGDGQ